MAQVTLFYDADCGFCQGSVDWLLAHALPGTFDPVAYQDGQAVRKFPMVDPSLADKGIQALMREVSSDVLVLALKAADEDLKSKIFGNMSKRAAELLKDDLEVKGPVRVSEVEAAQREILAVARRMADAGEIVLGGSSEQMI